MLGDESNGNSGKSEEDKPVVLEESAKKDAKPAAVTEAEAPKINKARIDNGTMTVTLELEGPDNSFAAAIGSLVLAQDMVRNYFAKKMMAEQLIKERVMAKIIRPEIH
jgi:hypothetical protein